MNLLRAIDTGWFVFEAENPSGGTPDTYVPPSAYSLVQKLYVNDLVSDVDPLKGKLIVPIGYIAQSPGGGDDFVVAIRGTDSIWEWIQDARFDKTPFTFAPGSGDTEDGFTAMYGSLGTNSAGGGPRAISAISRALTGKSTATLRIAGTSLGGALANLLALEVAATGVSSSPEVYTFASPYVGDSRFASAYNGHVPNTSRIANQIDSITHLPPALIYGYEHVGQVYMLHSAGKVKMDLACDHHLRTYLHLLSLLTAGAAIPLDADCV
jgi:triacylglycerol lipase